MAKKICLLIPAYNEESTIADTIKDFHKHLPRAEFVIVNNNSSDDTAAVAQKALKKLKHRGRVLNESRQGKGFAMRRGFSDIEADCYLMVDADTTYKAADVQKLIDPIINDEADMVVGDRISGGDYKSQNKRRFHSFGNALVTGIINVMFRSPLRDIMSGYRAFNKKFVKNFPIMSAGFEIETEMSLHALDKRFRIKEVDIEYVDRPEGSDSKLHTIRDGFRILRTILWVLKDYRPLPFFGGISLFLLLAGLGSGTPVILEFIATRYITHVPLAILATGLILSGILFFAIGLILDTVVRFHKFEYEQNLLAYRPDDK